MIPADAEAVVTSQDIAHRYQVKEATVAYWTTIDGFPEGWPSGPGRTLVRDAALVDQWLHDNLPVHWAKGQQADNPYGLPEGDPADLVTLSDICAWEAKALGRSEPVPTVTLRSYISRGKLAQPDRTPADGQQPEVTERMWLRKTAYDFVNRPRRMRRQNKEQAPSPSHAPAPPDTQPAAAPGTSLSRVDVDAIAAKFGIGRQTAKGWVQTQGFPQPDDNARYSAAEVDDWVRTARPRAWSAAVRRAALTAQPPAGPTPQQPDSEPCAPAPHAPQEGPAELTAAQIGPRYGVSEHTGLSWTTIQEKHKDGSIVGRPFPAPLRTRPRVYCRNDVDAWVKDHRPHVWAAFTHTEPLLNPLPDGNPSDLLDISDFAAIWGTATRGKPLARETLTAYHQRGQIPFADRTPDDGKKPRVHEYHWYRETVYSFIRSRKGPGNFEPRQTLKGL